MVSYSTGSNTARRLARRGVIVCAPRGRVASLVHTPHPRHPSRVHLQSRAHAQHHQTRIKGLFRQANKTSARKYSVGQKQTNHGWATAEKTMWPKAERSMVGQKLEKQ